MQMGNGKTYNFSKVEKKEYVNLLTGKYVNWSTIFNSILSRDNINVGDFLQSRDIFDIIETAYNEKFSQLPFLNFYWNIKSIFMYLLKLLTEEITEADIYHSLSTGYSGIIGSFAKYKLSKPFILTEHGIYTREREEEIIKSGWLKGCFKDIWINYFYSLSKCAYDMANNVITLFERNKDIEVELGCDIKKITIIPNGIDVKDYNDINRINNDGFINIGAIIRMVPIKDIKTMIHSFSLVKKSIKNTRLYIMGPWDENVEYYEECIKLVENSNIEDVIFTGKVNIKEYLCKIDLLMLTSISEGQPLAVLEGMAAKKPFVTTDVGSCKELLYGMNDNYGQAGIVCPVMDHSKIAKAVISLCNDRVKRDEMANSAYQRISKIYTKERLIESYKNLYNSYGV